MSVMLLEYASHNRRIKQHLGVKGCERFGVKLVHHKIVAKATGFERVALSLLVGLPHSESVDGLWLIGAETWGALANGEEPF
mgnify:CR=1 FL=1